MYCVALALESSGYIASITVLCCAASAVLCCASCIMPGWHKVCAVSCYYSAFQTVVAILPHTVCALSAGPATVVQIQWLHVASQDMQLCTHMWYSHICICIHPLPASTFEPHALHWLFTCLRTDTPALRLSAPGNTYTAQHLEAFQPHTEGRSHQSPCCSSCEHFRRSIFNTLPLLLVTSIIVVVVGVVTVTKHCAREHDSQWVLPGAGFAGALPSVTS